VGAGEPATSSLGKSVKVRLQRHIGVYGVFLGPLKLPYFKPFPSKRFLLECEWRVSILGTLR